MRKLAFYSFEEIAQLLHISVRTVRNYSWRKDFKIAGYKMVKGGKRIALVSEEEVKRLILRKLIQPKLPFH